MNKEYVVLLVIEGKESNTEVNFFNNFFHHFSSSNALIPVGFAKASKNKTHNYNLQKLNREVLSKIDTLDENASVFIFSFSDLEKRVEKSKNSMMSTSKKLKAQINKSNLKAKIFISDHIFFKDASFEDVLDFQFVNKRGPYMTGFNDFCEEKGLLNQDGLVDKELIRKYFKNNPLEPVINKIIEIM